MTPQEAVGGLTCMVVKGYQVYRGEIIHTNSYGTSEVSVVDDEETAHANSSDLFHSCTFWDMMPVMVVECALHGLTAKGDNIGPVTEEFGATSPW